jgi:hypothetical protein
MAVKPLTPAEQAELNRLLEENAQISERIQKINEKMATATDGERRQLEDMMKMEKDRLKVQTDITKSYQKRKEYLDYEKDAYESMASLGKNIRKEIDGQQTGTTALASVTNMVVKMKRRELSLEGETLQKSISRRETLEGLQNAVIEQAKSLAHHSGHHASHEEKIEKFEKSISHLTTKQKEEARALFKIKEKLEKKEERIAALHEQQHDLMHHIPSFITDATKYTKGLVGAIGKLGPLALVFAAAGAALHSFIALDKAAEDFRKETGLSNTQTKELAHQAHHIEMFYRDAGVELKDIFDTAQALTQEFSDSAKFSEEVLASITVLSKNFGITSASAAKVQSVFESVGGLSAETAANVQRQVAQMANLAGVAPEKVFKDIAENAEAASTFFKGDLNALTKNAIQAQRMGTSLKQQVSLAEKLLDFESGIEQELVAATFVGGEFNLSRARALAMEGKLQAANEETLRQVQRSGDFRKKDYFTQQQLAKAAGMSVEEINKQLNMQEKMNGLSEEEKKLATDAIDKGLDISNMTKEQLKDETKKLATQQEQQGQLTRMQNAFMGIVATVGGVLSPLLEGVANILNLILLPINAAAEGLAKMAGFLKENLDVAFIFLGVLGAINAKAIYSYTIEKLKYAQQILNLALTNRAALADKKGLLAGVAKMAISAYNSIASAIPVIGPILGAAAAAGAYMLGKSYFAKAGDLMSPADGKTRVSTKEGGLFELSPNDDLIAAPGAANSVGAGNSGGGVNLSALAAPLNAVVNEIKALRADMASGKIAVYMDSAKVTAGVNTQVEKSTRNNFALGQS